ncbi:hypothetical protein FRX31_017061, partial [Thalictrum thalictroides]
PILCRKLADNSAEFWSVLPLVQALLPALRPPVSSPDHVDDSFSQWKQPYVKQALSQIVALSSSSSVYRPLLHVCAGYLSSFSPSHAKTACVLIDLCSGPLAPWMSTVIAKVDLTIELLEDLLGTIQRLWTCPPSHSLYMSLREESRQSLRPPVSSPDHVDDSFSQWKQPYVKQALSQIVALSSSSSVYRPLLHVCAGYLSSFSPSHAKTACVLIDLCSGPLAPWMSTVIAKVDLTIELLEDLLGTIQVTLLFSCS